MALVVKDRVKETTTTTGTGTLALAGASSGFQSFAAIGNGNQTYYVITDVATGDWEVGIGTYTASGTTLSRTTVLSSSNGGNLVPLAAGVKDVFVAYPAERAVYLDTAGAYPVQATFNTITATTATLTNGTVSTTPSSATDIANKSYVDTLVSSGITYHAPVKYEVPNSTGNLNALYNQPGGPGVGVGATLTNNGTKAAFAPDGPTAQIGDRILVYNQTNAFENGVYTVTTVGTPDPGGTNWVLTRATDADTYGLKSPNSLGEGDAFFITSGNTGAGETYVCNTQGTITFGTTSITFVQVASAQIYSAGTGLTLSGTQFSITNTGVSANTYGTAADVPVFAVNAQGQITSVTNTPIAISGSAVSGNISGSAGSVANSLTAGTYLTGGTFNGSAPVTFTVDATSANTASKVVARDASGNFSAGTITASLSGNATTATTATNVAGGTANQLLYQSSAGITAFATAPSATNQVLNWNGSAFTWVAGTISGIPLGSNLNSLTAGTYLTGTAYNGGTAQTWSVDATSANTASKVVARDASGNFSAGTITASLSGTAATADALNTGNSYTVAGMVVNANSSTNALRITQTGSGNALLVEDSANPDATPTVIDASGQVFVGSAVSAGATSTGVTPSTQIVGTGATAGSANNKSSIGLYRFFNDASGPGHFFFKSRSASPGTFATVNDGDTLGSLLWQGDDGSNFPRAAQISAAVDGTPGTNDMPGRLVFSTTADGASSPTERMRIDSAGNVGIGSSAGTATSFRLANNLTGSTSAFGLYSVGVVQSDVTGGVSYLSTQANTAAATFTISNLRHYVANQGTFGAGSTVNNQFGFVAQSALIGATNNYGFYSDIASGTGRWNFYANGTAANVFAGQTSIGGLVGSESLRVNSIASSVNRIQAEGAVTGSGPVFRVEGSDTNVSFTIGSKGTGTLWFATNRNAGFTPQLAVVHTASAVNYVQATGGATGTGPTFSVAGSDTNINLNLTPKGTGVVNITAGGLRFPDGSTQTAAGATTTGDGSVIQNNTTITGTSSLAAGTNGFSVGPITVASGASFTVPSGRRWLVL